MLAPMLVDWPAGEVRPLPLQALGEHYRRYRLPDAESEAAMAQLGMRPMMTGYSSIRYDLRPSPERLRSQLDGKWRNTLKTAEKSALLMETASVAAGSWNPEAFEALLGEHARHRLEAGFLGPDARFYAAFADAVEAGLRNGLAGEDALLFWAHAGTHLGRVRPIAGPRGCGMGS